MSPSSTQVNATDTRYNVKYLVAAIRAFIDGWNDRCSLFTWTKTADEIGPHATRNENSDARQEVSASESNTSGGRTSMCLGRAIRLFQISRPSRRRRAAATSAQVVRRATAKAGM